MGHTHLGMATFSLARIFIHFSLEIERRLPCSLLVFCLLARKKVLLRPPKEALFQGKVGGAAWNGAFCTPILVSCLWSKIVRTPAGQFQLISQGLGLCKNSVNVAACLTIFLDKEY